MEDVLGLDVSDGHQGPRDNLSSGSLTSPYTAAVPVCAQASMASFRACQCQRAAGDKPREASHATPPGIRVPVEEEVVILTPRFLIELGKLAKKDATNLLMWRT